MRFKLQCMGAVLAVLWLASVSHSFPGYLTTFNNTYTTSTLGTSLSCGLCHDTTPPAASFTPYGTEVSNATGAAFVDRLRAVEPMDADGDGFTNKQEIAMNTNPNVANTTATLTPSPTASPSPTATPTGNWQDDYDISVKPKGAATISASGIVFSGSSSSFGDLSIRKKKSVSTFLGRPIPLIQSPGSFRRIFVQNGEVKKCIAGGTINNLSTKDGWVDATTATQFVVVRMNASPMTTRASVSATTEPAALCQLFTAGSGGAAKRADIRAVGVYLVDVQLPNQTVSQLRASAKKNLRKTGSSREQFISNAGIGSPLPRLTSDTLSTSDTTTSGTSTTTGTTTTITGPRFNVVTLHLINCSTLGASVNVHHLTDVAGPRCNIHGFGQVITLNNSGSKSRLALPGNIYAVMLFSGSQKLNVTTKGGDIDVDELVCANEVTLVQSKALLVNNGSKSLLGGFVGDPTEAPSAPKSYTWPGQMMIASGGFPGAVIEVTTGVASAARTSTDIKRVHGDLGVFAACYANVDAPVGTGPVTINGSIGKIDTLLRLPNVPGVTTPRIQGLGVSSKDFTVVPAPDPNFFLKIIGTFPVTTPAPSPSATPTPTTTPAPTTTSVPTPTATPVV